MDSGSTKIKVLHILRGGVIMTNAITEFESYTNLVNYYILYSPKNQYKPITIDSKIQLINTKTECLSYINNSSCNIIYLHSLDPELYDVITKINRDKTVIWWVWGYDIYYSHHGLKPLVNCNLYQPLTAQWLVTKRTFKHFIKVNIIDKVCALKWKYLQKKVLSRIDYVKPVLPIELQLLSESGYEFKPFMSTLYTHDIPKLHINNNEKQGHVLIGNSANVTGNQLDLLPLISKFRIKGKYIFPLNYGDEDYRNELINSDFIIKNENNVKLLLDIIPYDEYNELLSNCTHAIFGCMRQQAIGNISICIKYGIKLFFYRDSINYLQLKQLGLHVFTIENDLSEENLNTPLTYKEAIENIKRYYNLTGSKTNEYVYESFKKLIK